jgi:hypothetical protein
MNPKARLENSNVTSLMGIIPMLTQDNSICKFQRTMFLKLGSHYPPLWRCAFGIGVSQ